MKTVTNDQDAPLADAEMDFLSGGGEMARLLRLKDWSATPLGPIECWPQSLRTTVSLCLASNFPINIIWGPRHVQLYNDGYRTLCGDEHPALLGMDYSVSWASAWPAIGEPFARALRGETCLLENQRMFLDRNGYLEETFFTFSLSPIRDESGRIGGVFHPVTETTAAMLRERRTCAGRDLTTNLRRAKTTHEVFSLAVDTLESFTFDLPFVLLYQLEKPVTTAHSETELPCYRLVAQTGLPAGTAAAPRILEACMQAPWPVAELMHTRFATVVKGLSTMAQAAPCGPYDEPPDLALALPVILPGSDLPDVIMIAGVSARLPLDDVYRSFYDLIVTELAAGLTQARACEQERRRVEALVAIGQAKTTFFSDVLDEFRVPLMLMLGPIEDAVAEVDGLPTQQRERLEVTHRNAQRLLKLVDTMPGFSLLPVDWVRGPRSLARRDVPVSAGVEEALRWPPHPDGAGSEPLDSEESTLALSRPRIVLADDDGDTRAHISRILSQAGYVVEAVENGVAAVAAARRELPDLLLTDVATLGMGDVTTLRALRNDPALAGLPVILLSVRAEDEARIKGLMAGADDYLVKPFSARKLRTSVDGAIKLVRQRRDAAQHEHGQRAELAAQRARADLLDSENRLGMAMEAGRLGRWELDLGTKRFIPSGTGRGVMGLDPSEPLETYDDLLRNTHPDDRGMQRAAVEQAVGTRSDLHVEYRALHPDGHVSWVEVRGRPVYAEDGMPLRMMGVSLDISARKQGDERQKLLLDELNHRVKNTLATVQSIAMQTERNAKTPARFSTDLAARIEALAGAHDLLTRASWNGVSLVEVVKQAIAPYGRHAEENPRIETSGPPVRLCPNAVVTLNMAFHELAANAAAYGALSVPGGRVSIQWNVQQRAIGASVEVLWCEAGGPKVQPPSRRGFGSRLLEQGLAAELEGDVDLQFAPEGVCCRMRLPISAKIALAM